MLKRATYCLSALLITACSQFIGRQAPAPIYYSPAKQESSPAVKLSSVERSKQVKLVQIHKPIQRVHKEPEQIFAIQQLLADAELNYQQGKIEIAAMTLERALRIAPRHAILFYKLAALRMHQGQFLLAENLAKKSELLAVGDYSLKKQNWLLIAAAREQLGQAEKADKARQNAQRYSAQ